MAKEIHDIRNFIKGKIAEIIFEELFREGSNFEVIPFGYEKNFPEIAQYQNHFSVQKVLRTMRHMPDYLLVSPDKIKLFLVEVKYCTHLDSDQTHRIAEEITKYWNNTWLFIATPGEFYFDSCSRIIENDGRINKLQKTWIANDDLYMKYLKLLQEFEQHSI